MTDATTAYYRDVNRGGWYTDELEERAEALLDNTDFAGLVFQHWHCSGDERLPNGNKEFAPRSVGRDLLARLLYRADRTEQDFTVIPVYYEPLNTQHKALRAYLSEHAPLTLAAFDRGQHAAEEQTPT